MHITEYESYEGLISTLVKTSENGVLILTVHHESEDGDEIAIPKISIPADVITPVKWNHVIKKSTFMMIEEGTLEEIYLELVKLVLRIRMGEFTEVSAVIIDGVVLKITDVFSKFLEKSIRCTFAEFNFRLIYGIFDKIQELDEISGYKVQLNESGDIWKIVEKVYVPCEDGADYRTLIQYIGGEEVDYSENSEIVVMGSTKFVKLSDILYRIKLKWKND